HRARPRRVRTHHCRYRHCSDRRDDLPSRADREHIQQRRQQPHIAIDALRVIEDALLIAFVAVVIVTDWRWQRIPNQVTYPTMVIGLVLGALEGLSGIGVGEPFRDGFLDHLTGLVLAFLVCYPFYAGGGLKAGDARDNLTKLLGFESDIEIVGTAGGGQEAITLAKKEHPDAILMDINMQDMDGITATEIISNTVPESPIIMMSVQGEQDYLRR